MNLQFTNERVTVHGPRAQGYQGSYTEIYGIRSSSISYDGTMVLVCGTVIIMI